MVPINTSVLTIIITLAPLFYLLLASPAFLLADLSTPQVAWLLRKMFSGYFIVLMVMSFMAVLLNMLSGNLFPSVVSGLLTAFAFACRHWMMPRVNVALAEIEAAHAGADSRLRRLHWLGMGVNAVLVVVLLMLVPMLVVD